MHYTNLQGHSTYVAAEEKERGQSTSDSAKNIITGKCTFS